VVTEEGPDRGPDTRREYRTAELAEAAGISVRTLRFYRERKLVPPPRREGRIAWYDTHHLARLRTIGALLRRGHTLGGIAELLTAFEHARDAGELLGLGSALATPWSEETPVRLTPDELAGRFEGEITPENLAASLDIGYLTADGEELVHVSRRLLDASTALIQHGVPLAAILAAGREVRAHADALADVFTDLIRTHALAASATPDDLAAVLDRLRPIARTVVEAEVAMAMDRRLGAERGERRRG
jgi:DNA-binding transcriptional MerR regulator